MVDFMVEKKIVKLSDLCKKDSIGIYGIPATAEEYSDEKVRYLRITDINDDGTINNSDMKSVSDDNLEKYMLQPGDIVFARTGNSTGRSYLYNEKDGKFAFAGFLIKYGLDDTKINPTYVRYFTISDYYKQWVSNLSSGSTRGNISAQTFADCPIIVPSRKQLDFLATSLSTIDQRIENLRAQNRVLEQTAKTIYDYTFLQCVGHQTTYNKALNRNIPADWEVKRLGDLVSVSKESLNPQNYPEKQFKHFSIPSFDDNGSYSLEYGKDIFSNKFIVNNNHVLISKLNPWKNRAVWCDENDDAIGSTEFVTLLPRKLENKAFVFSIVKSGSFIEYCSDAATGTSHSHRRVSPDIMMKFPIAYDEKTVIKFNAQVTPLFKKQLVNTKQIEALTTQRNTLLPLLMTGQIEV